jgi:hypothetical protein
MCENAKTMAISHTLFRFLAPLICGSMCFVPGVRAEDDITWRHSAEKAGVTLTANPLSREGATAFYLARGFSADAIRPYAEACGFSIGMRNGGASPLVARLAEWHAVGADGAKVALRLPGTWDAVWEKAALPESARIAFRWAQFQAENRFEPGDWIMGMATLEGIPSTPFRFVARYRNEKGDHEIVLDGLACTGD